VAQCVWRLVSIIGLEQGLISHIDILRRREIILPQTLAEAGPDNIEMSELEPIINMVHPTRRHDITMI
jgi:hypothetical protein